jgi:biotin carboxyl carrier protein
MESTVTAPFDGKVKQVHLNGGVMVQQDDLIVEFESL